MHLLRPSRQAPPFYVFCRDSWCSLRDVLDSTYTAVILAPTVGEITEIRAREPEPLVDSRRVARILGVAPRTVSQLVAEDGLPAYRLTPKAPYRFRLSEVEAWIAERRIA